MKKKVISVILATMIMAVTSVPAFATPNSQVEETQSKFEELQNKVNEMEAKVQELNCEIEPLVDKIETNSKEIKNIEDQIENSKMEIETAKQDIEKQEDILDERVRELYKSGGSTNYLMILFSANSITDLFSKLDAANRIVDMDKKVVQELETKQQQLQENIESLEVKSKEIEKITEETQVVLKEAEEKKAAQQVLVDEAEAERASFLKEYLIPVERELVQNDISILSSSSDISTLNSAISRLQNIRDKQPLKSDTVISEVNSAINSAKSKINSIKAQENASQVTPNRGEGSASGQAIVDYAYKFLGTPYLWGGTTPAGFDCSGFTSYVYRNVAGIDISRTTYTQRYMGRSVPYSEMKVGDLVFTSNYNHVGIYVGGGNFIHAPRTGDVVKVSSIYKFAEARRIIE